MSNKDRHQRRRRRLIGEIAFKAITLLGQAIYYFVRFWFIDRE